MTLYMKDKHNLLCVSTQPGLLQPCMQLFNLHTYQDISYMGTEWLVVVSFPDPLYGLGVWERDYDKPPDHTEGLGTRLGLFLFTSVHNWHWPRLQHIIAGHCVKLITRVL